MKLNSSFSLFVLGLFLLALVLLSVVAEYFYSRHSVHFQKMTGAGPSLYSEGHQSLTSFESGQDQQELKKAKEHLLNSYGWIDQKKQIIHVPLSEAIKLYLEEEHD